METESNAACSINLNPAFTPEQRQRYQNPEVIRSLLDSSKIIAIVGLSADPQKASHLVASYLQNAGYTIVPVNPHGGEILGQHVYPDLLSIPMKVDLVDIFRPAQEVAGLVDQAIAIKARAVWTQLRIVDLRRCREGPRGRAPGCYGQVHKNRTRSLAC